MTLPAWMTSYLTEIDAEYRRIGFTEDELIHLASNADPDEKHMRESLEHLRSLPSGIGAAAYFANVGGNYEPLREAVEVYHRQQRMQD